MFEMIMFASILEVAQVIGILILAKILMSKRVLRKWMIRTLELSKECMDQLSKSLEE